MHFFPLVHLLLLQPLFINTVIIYLNTIALDNDVVISVVDDGAGMTKEKLSTMMRDDSSQGLGIAVKNVHDRMKGYFGPESTMTIDSELGEGTTVTFVLKNAAASYVATSGLTEVAAEQDLAEDIVEDAADGTADDVSAQGPLEVVSE